MNIIIIMFYAHRHSVFRVLLLLSTLMFSNLSHVAYADGLQSFTKKRISAANVAPGGAVRYRLEGACTAITGACGTLTITDPVPAQLSAVSCTAPVGYTINQCSPAGINITKNSFNGGDTYQITIDATVDAGAADGAVTNIASAEISTGPDGTPDIANDSATVTVDSSLTPPLVDGVWFFDVLSSGCASSNPVKPTIKLCSSRKTGNTDLNNASMSLNVGVSPDSINNTNGGTIAGDTITWNLGNIDLDSLYSGLNPDSTACITKQVDINFNAGDFASSGVGTAVSLTGNATGTPPAGAALNFNDTHNLRLKTDCSAPGFPAEPVPVVYLQKSAGAVTNFTTQYTLNFSHHLTYGSGEAFANPILADLLPLGVEFVSWDSENISNNNSGGNNFPGANLEVIENYQGTNRTLVRFTWQVTPPLGSIDINGNPGASNPITVPPPEFGGTTPLYIFTEQFTVRFSPIVGAGSLENKAHLTVDAANFFFCDSASANFDEQESDIGIDLNGDGVVDNTVFCEKDATVSVPTSMALAGEKLVKGSAGLLVVDDPTSAPAVSDLSCKGYPSSYTKHPCVAQTTNNGEFEYLLEFTNSSNIDLKEYTLYDVLPHVGDTGVGPSGAAVNRNSEWDPQGLTGPISFAGGEDYFGVPLATANTNFVVEYSTAANPCRSELNAPQSNSPPAWPSGCDATYGPLPADPSTVTAFRIYGWNSNTASDKFLPGHTYRFKVPMRAPVTALTTPDPTNAADFHPTWNSFSHLARQASNSSNWLTHAEPNKVGIIVQPGKDLSVNKSNDTNDQGSVGVAYTWNITMNSTGGEDIVFNNGEVILRDHLPAGPTYNNINVALNAGVTGGISCGIAANVLECTASSTVTFDGTTADVSITFEVTPTASGNLVNPTGGVCQVDPDALHTELSESNNDCSDTVVIGNAPTGTIKIVKDAVPNSTQLFTFSSSGTNFPPLAFQLADNGGGSTAEQLLDNLGAGTYNINETVVAGWTLTGRNCINSNGVMTSTVTNTATGIEVVLVPGEDLVCTFTNTQDAVCSLSADITPSACTNVGNDADASNDTFNLNVEITGNNTGTSNSYSYTSSSNNISGSGSYGSVETDGPFVIAATSSPFSLTVVDSVDSNCSVTVNNLVAPSTCSTTAPAQVDLSISKTVDTAIAQSGDALVYTLTVNNAGAIAATGIVVEDVLPPGVTYVSDTGGSDTSENNGTITWSISSLAANTDISLNITVTVD